MTHPFQIGDTVSVDLWSPNTCGFERRMAVVMHAYVDTYGRYACLLYPVDETQFKRVLPGSTYRSIKPHAESHVMCFADDLALVHPSPWRTIPVKGKLLPMVGEPLGVRNVTVNSVNWTPMFVAVNGTRHSKSTVPKSNFTTF